MRAPIVSVCAYLRGRATHLVAGRVHAHLEVLEVGEARVRLVGGVAEVLHLGLLELAHAEQARARRDLVAEGGADLGGGEGQLALVELQQPLEVHEHALGRFGPQETANKRGT